MRGDTLPDRSVDILDGKSNAAASGKWHGNRRLNRYVSMDLCTWLFYAFVSGRTNMSQLYWFSATNCRKRASIVRFAVSLDLSVGLKIVSRARHALHAEILAKRHEEFTHKWKAVLRQKKVALSRWHDPMIEKEGRCMRNRRAQLRYCSCELWIAVSNNDYNFFRFSFAIEDRVYS